MAQNKANTQNKKKIVFDPTAIELKWQAKWESEGTYQPDLEAAKGRASSDTSSAKHEKPHFAEVSRGRPFYNLMMFPYPSAEGLHVGSMYAFGGVDVYGRFQRMRGYQVFEPIGLDGFGIHSENHAIKTNTHPIDHAKRTQENFYRQLHAIGNSYAWKNKLETYDPDYYRWTQWLFVQLFKSGLSYKKNSPVNFCPSCKTVLSDEQVIKKIKDQRSKIKSDKDTLGISVCERCETPVEKRDLEQWFFRITQYAERLLGNIEKLDWTEKVKLAQKNWIGKSEGVRFQFSQTEHVPNVEVFTTAIDTVYGVTFVVISPEHPLLKQIMSSVPDEKRKKEVQKYIKVASMKSTIDRQAEGKEKTGVFTGAYVKNPLTDEEVPLWVADYVLMDYGTGIVMGVPGHDARDHEFAQKFGLEIRPVFKPKAGVVNAHVENDGFWNYQEIKHEFKEKSELFNSGKYNGMSSKEAKQKLIEELESKGYGKREVTYHLRDWLISRQRYWGPPIPMIHCDACAKKGDSWFTSSEYSEKSESQKVRKSESLNVRKTESSEFSGMAGWYPVPEEDLPVKLPYIENFKPLGTGKAPLANHPEFYETTCPRCGGKATRETDVSDTFLDSSWYFLRYLATDWENIPFPSEKYISEHSEDSESLKSGKSDRLKIRYSEFSEKVKSRSRWLPVTSYIGGAEHSVLHLLYARFITMALKDMGYVDFEEPFSRFYAHGLIIKDGAKMSKSKGNIINPDEYINKYGADTLRTYLLFLGPFNQGGDFRDSGIDGMSRFLKRVWALLSDSEKYEVGSEKSAERLKMLHETIKGITEDMENLRFNTSIAKLMTYYNFLAKQPSLHRDEVEVYLKLLAPFAPHMTEELYQALHSDKQQVTSNKFESIHTSDWPTFDEKYLKVESVTIAVQINGKLRGTLQVSINDKDNQAMLEKLAKEDEHVTKFLEGTIKKVILVPGKILNFVVS